MESHALNAISAYGLNISHALFSMDRMKISILLLLKCPTVKLRNFYECMK